MKKIRQRNLQLILDAACEVFADCGFSAARLSDVAERAGVAKANVLYYYRSKAQLYEAVLDSIVEPLLEASRPFAGDQPPPPRYARRQQDAHRRRAAAGPGSRDHARRAAHAGGAAGTPRRPGGTQRRAHPPVDRRSLLAPLDPYHLLLNLWAMTESYALGGWQLARLTGQAGLDASDYRQAAENIVRLVCAGCLALPARPRRVGVSARWLAERLAPDQFPRSAIFQKP